MFTYFSVFSLTGGRFVLNQYLIIRHNIFNSKLDEKCLLLSNSYQNFQIIVGMYVVDIG